MGVRAVGLTDVRRQLEAAGEAVADLAPVNATVGEYIAGRAKPRMPRRTGRLVANTTVIADGHAVIIRTDTPYARPVLFGAPAAGTPAARVTPYAVAVATQAEWLGIYTDHAADACGLVKG